MPRLFAALRVFNLIAAACCLIAFAAALLAGVGPAGWLLLPAGLLWLWVARLWGRRGARR
jgi:hypothetical protein